MPSTILSDNGVSSGSAGLKTTAASDGSLALQTTTAGGAATTAVTIDTSQNVGVGTSSPTAKLQVGDGSASTGVKVKGTASFLTLDGSSYGQLVSTSTLYLDAGSGQPIILRPNGSTEAARITSSGIFVIGANSAHAIGGGALQTVYAGNCFTSKAALDGTSGAGAWSMIGWNSGNSGNNGFIEFGTETTYTARGNINYNRGSGVVAYNTTSDYRSKIVNGPVQNALSKVATLKPCTGRMNGAEFDIDFFVAHELQEVVPAAVTGEKDAVKEDGTPDYQMVDKTALIPLLTAAIQELNAKVDAQAAEIAALKGN